MPPSGAPSSLIEPCRVTPTSDSVSGPFVDFLRISLRCLLAYVSINLDFACRKANIEERERERKSEERPLIHSLHTNQGCYWSHSSDHQFFATQQTLQSEPCLNLSLVCWCEVAPMASCTVQWSWNVNMSFLTMSSLAWIALQDMNIRNWAKPCFLSKRLHEKRHLLPLGVAAKTSEELEHSHFLTLSLRMDSRSRFARFATATWCF